MTKSQFHRHRSNACVREAFKQHEGGVTGLATILAILSSKEVLASLRAAHEEVRAHGN